MGNDPVNNVDPDGGSIGGWIRPFLQALNLVRPATPAIGQFSGVAQATSLSGSTAAGTSGGVSTSGGLLNSLGNAAASALGQWVANKLLPMPQGPDARALQQIADLRQSMNAEPPYLQCGFATGNPAAALRTWKTTQKIAGWIEVLGGGPEDPVADVLAGGVEIVGGAISLYKAFWGAADLPATTITTPPPTPVTLTKEQIEQLKKAWEKLLKSARDKLIQLKQKTHVFAKSIEQVSDAYLKEKGIDAHALKEEWLGKKGKNSDYDIFKNKDTKELEIYRKGGKGEGIETGIYLND